MKRKVIDVLIKWREETYNIPILITGAKGVGKTYLTYDFARAFFERIYYINFEREPEFVKLFLSKNPDFITNQLITHYQIDQNGSADNRILILDEISFCEEALNIIKSTEIQNVFHHIILISSSPSSLEQPEHPVQYMQLILYPLEFDEFLLATGNEWYIETIHHHYHSNTKIPDIVHNELIDLHELYLRIGGMPAMVNEYLNLLSVINISERHSFLVGSYHDYILRDNSESDALKMNQVYDSLVYQLMKENKKFQYKLIRKGTTHAMCRDAIRKLTQLNYVIKCNRISSEQLLEPSLAFSNENLSSEDGNTNFKLYLSDTGILYSKIIEEQNNLLLTKYKKTLLENYVAQSLQAKNYPFAFWESDSMAKIDFIIYKNDELIPIELYENEQTRSKSISILKQKCNFPYAVKISSKNFEYSNQVKYVPYYAVFCL
ncbi:MAG: AAA family ATPase [Herbinix sp.]|nr:AAA family ATPase [Herbinix sp.]